MSIILIKLRANESNEGQKKTHESFFDYVIVRDFVKSSNEYFIGHNTWFGSIPIL